jgi:hypothetical protein
MSDKKFVQVKMTMNTRQAQSVVSKIANLIGGSQGEYVAHDGDAVWSTEEFTLCMGVQVRDEDHHFVLQQAVDHFYARLEQVEVPTEDILPLFSIAITDAELLLRNLMGETGTEDSGDDFPDDEGLAQEVYDPYDDDDSGQLVAAGSVQGRDAA